MEKRIHSGNYTYFQTFFQQFNNDWKILGDLQKPIYQNWRDNASLFGYFYKMDDYNKHRLPENAFGPDYPGSHMLSLVDRINLQNLTKKGLSSLITELKELIYDDTLRRYRTRL